MKSLETIVAAEKNAQQLIAQATQNARDIVIQAEKMCQQLQTDWLTTEKQLDYEVQSQCTKKRLALEKKFEQKDLERLEALQAQIKKNTRVAQNILLERLR